jgi:murein DD-endopeptidase MepM/ murein hydrolase activator NlpD
MFFNGKTLVVSHGQGVFSSFVHLSEILVKEGQSVKRGEAIARMGATGRVTGPHLHWSIKYRGIPVDPALLLSKDSPVCVKEMVRC